MSKLGLSFSENMYGTFNPVAEPHERRTFMFHLTATASSLARAVLWDGKLRTRGYVVAEGLAQRAPFEGELVIKFVFGRFIRYEFEFVGDDGERYRYAGQKTLRLHNPKRSMTVLRGAIYDAAGRTLFESTSYFDLAELLPFLRSYSLTAGEA
jgi:hypothetical protein